MLIVNVGMALQAVLVGHQHLFRDEIAGDRACTRRVEVGQALLRADGVPLPRVLGVHDPHAADEQDHAAGPGIAPFPLDVRPRMAVPQVQADRGNRDQDVQPVNEVAAPGAGGELRQPFELDQRQTGETDEDARGKQRQPQLDRQAVLARPRRGVVRQPEEDERQHDDHADHDVNKEHPEGELIGIGPWRLPPVEEADRRQVDAAGAEHGDGAKDDEQEHLQPRADRGLVDISPAVAQGGRRRDGRGRGLDGRLHMVHDITSYGNKTRHDGAE